MGNQEVSKPVMIAIIAAAVIVFGLIGWWYFAKPEKYPGYQAPAGGYGRPSGGMVPGMGMEMQRQAPGGMPPAGAPR